MPSGGIRRSIRRAFLQQLDRTRTGCFVTMLETPGSQVDQHDAVQWTLMIARDARDGNCKQAFWRFQQMQLEGWRPDAITLATLLNACEGIHQVKIVHDKIVERGLESNEILRNVLLKMYGKWGSLHDSQRLFKQMPQRDVITWTSMIAQCKCPEEAFGLFRGMQLEGITPDRVAFLTILNACSCSLDFLAEGRQMHRLIVEAGHEDDVVVETSLVNMYSKCGSLQDAVRTFSGMLRRDSVVWNVLIGSHVERNLCRDALRLFRLMLGDGIWPDKVTCVFVFNACASLRDLAEGKLLHVQIAGTAIESDPIVGNALVDMYGKCGSLDEGKKLFDGMQEKTVVSWNALIAAYAQHGYTQDTQRGYALDALKLFRHMLMEGFTANIITLASMVDACTALGSLVQGRFVHACILEARYESQTALGNVLVVMYAKCGSLTAARSVFDRMLHRDLISWNAMISAYGCHGLGEESLKLFFRMQQDGVNKPDTVTFINLLSACGHAGLVAQGSQYFGSMKAYCGIEPTEEHRGCVVDLLGRVGWLEQAEQFIMKMPFHQTSSTLLWRTLLSACSTHGDTQRGKRVTKRILEIDSLDSAAYVALSNIYSASDYVQTEQCKPILEA